jgi:hypothetical protein
VCVWVCVCVFEKERKRERERTRKREREREREMGWDGDVIKMRVEWARVKWKKERKKDVAGDSSSSTEKVSLDIADVAELTFK